MVCSAINEYSNCANWNFELHHIKNECLQFGFRNYRFLDTLNGMPDKRHELPNQITLALVKFSSQCCEIDK